MASTERLHRRLGGHREPSTTRSISRRCRSRCQHRLGRARRDRRAARADARRRGRERLPSPDTRLARLHRQVRFGRADISRGDGGRSGLHASPARTLARAWRGLIRRAVRRHLARCVLHPGLEHQGVPNCRNGALDDVARRGLCGARRARADSHRRRQAADERPPSSRTCALLWRSRRSSSSRTSGFQCSWSSRSR
jgi:hypothetical protein